MNIAKVVQIDTAAFGVLLGKEEATVQSEFFKGLAAELISWASTFLVERQFLSVGEALTNKEKRALEVAFRCLWYKEEET